MADDIVEDQITELIESYVAHLEGEGPAPSLDGLDAATRREARNAFRAVDAAWRSDLEIPPLEEDPVALALGFVPRRDPESFVVISGRLVKNARQGRGLKTSDVAARLESMGLAAADQKWLGRLERAPVQEVARHRHGTGRSSWVYRRTTSRHCGTRTPTPSQPGCTPTSSMRRSLRGWKNKMVERSLWISHLEHGESS